MLLPISGRSTACYRGITRLFVRLFCVQSHLLERPLSEDDSGGGVFFNGAAGDCTGQRSRSRVVGYHLSSKDIRPIRPWCR